MRPVLAPSTSAVGAMRLIIAISAVTTAASSTRPRSTNVFAAAAAALVGTAGRGGVGVAAAATASRAGSYESEESASSSRRYRDFEVLEVVHHDASSFTQGLTYFDGHLYEGTGLYGESELLMLDPADGMRTVRRVPLPASAFGEGVAHYYRTVDGGEDGRERHRHRLIQLTWKEKLGLIYDLPFPPLENDGEGTADEEASAAGVPPAREFSFETTTGEGWGITYRPSTDELYVSDGSEHILVWDAETLEEKRRMQVTMVFDRHGEEPVRHLVKNINELEFIDYGDGDGGECGSGDGADGTCRNDDEENNGGGNDPPGGARILANVWYEDVILSIDPNDGAVLKVYDLRELYPHDTRAEGADCLNGISVVSANQPGDAGKSTTKNELWVTGKLWPNMYRVRLID